MRRVPLLRAPAPRTSDEDLYRNRTHVAGCEDRGEDLGERKLPFAGKNTIRVAHPSHVVPFDIGIREMDETDLACLQTLDAGPAGLTDGQVKRVEDEREARLGSQRSRFFEQREGMVAKPDELVEERDPVHLRHSLETLEHPNRFRPIDRARDGSWHDDHPLDTKWRGQREDPPSLFRQPVD